MNTTAVISPCGLYRYVITRHIPSVLRWNRRMLIMLCNPSTACVEKSDNTFTLCINLAKREHCTSVTLINPFALRSTDPESIATHPDPIGPDNQRHIDEQIDIHATGILVVAWGGLIKKHVGSRFPLTELRQQMRDRGALCLGMTKDGEPRHPLYLKSSTPLIRWTEIQSIRNPKHTAQKAVS